MVLNNACLNNSESAVLLSRVSVSACDYTDKAIQYESAFESFDIDKNQIFTHPMNF